MKKTVCNLMFAVLSLLMVTSCSTNKVTNRDVLVSPAWVVTEDAQDEYSMAAKRWKSHHISSYEITMSISSSVLPPPCSSKVTLQVQNHELFAVTELETPMPIQLSDGSAIYNPECHDYENYLMEKQFEMVENLLTGKLSYAKWGVKFDPTDGYITELVFVPTGEAVRLVSYSNFTQR